MWIMTRNQKFLLLAIVLKMFHQEPTVSWNNCVNPGFGHGKYFMYNTKTFINLRLDYFNSYYIRLIDKCVDII